jgi:hypothetical protein
VTKETSLRSHWPGNVTISNSQHSSALVATTIWGASRPLDLWLVDDMTANLARAPAEVATCTPKFVPRSANHAERVCNMASDTNDSISLAHILLAASRHVLGTLPDEIVNGIILTYL